MTWSGEERRRWPRVPVEGTVELSQPVEMSARVRDVSAAGVLLSTSRKFERGDRARVHVTLGEAVLHADIEVRYVRALAGAGQGFRVGARFLDLDEDSRRALGGWLPRAGK